MIFRAITLISCGIIGGWLGFMASDRQVPVKYYTSDVLNTPKQGEPLRVKYTVWRDRSCATTVYRSIFDHGQRRFVVADLDFSPGVLPLGYDTFIVPVPISPEATAGEAVYRVVRIYRCNLLHFIWPIEDGPHDMRFTVATQ